MDIRILPANIANVIAAGEVVERPASVVKELMENAVDAGADNISVIISDAGRTLIQVIDNGCGMSQDEAVLCFERHATSKIATVEDLMNIHTLGFRGEALASIAAIAEVTLKTRRTEDEVGCEVVFDNSKLVSNMPVSTPVGSNFAVRNLFYNVPARRKFLKSDAAEMKHIVSEFVRVAMVRPDIAFSMTHNGKNLYSLKKDRSLKFRIQNLCGSVVANEIVDINVQTHSAKISGFVGRPSASRKQLGDQYFFVNGRYFISRYLHKAVMNAYQNLIVEGVTPAYFIFFEVDPKAVDVNVSPKKTEVKFEDEAVLFQSLSACIRKVLGQNSFSADIDFERDSAVENVLIDNKFRNYNNFPDFDFGGRTTYNPFDNEEGAPGHHSGAGAKIPEGFPGEEKFSPGQQQYHIVSTVSHSQNYGKLFEDKVLPSKQVLVFQNKYLLTAVKSGLLVVDIRRARERILYDRFLKAIAANAHVTQLTLFPVRVKVGVENIALFEEYSSILTASGFDISPIGRDEVVVNGVPEGYSVDQDKVKAMVSDLVVVLEEEKTTVPEMMAASMAERFARLGASGEAQITSTIEAQNLIDVLFGCENPEFTNSGRRTMSIVSADELNKKFN